jgi:3-hydroxyacyl-[acyl-carrier-protein] dehydratase
MRKEIGSYLEDFVTEGDVASAGVLFPESFSGFQGHFPDQPVLPGVCQIALAMVMAERMRGTRQRLAEVVNAKFVAMVLPNQPLRIECHLVGDILKAKLLSGGERVAEFKLRVEDA